MEAIGLVGGLASGKDSFGKFIVENKGGFLISSSSVARDYILNNSLGEPTRDMTRLIAAHLRNKFGKDYLIKKCVESMPREELLVVSGLYVIEEVIALRSLFKSVIVHVETPDELRMHRAVKRSRSTDESDFKNFYRLDNEDMSASITDQCLGDVIKLSDINIDGSIPISNKEYWNLQMENVFKYDH